MRTFYVKDNELPKNCHQCEFSRDEYIMRRCRVAPWKWFMIGPLWTVCKNDKFRNEHCPLRPLSDLIEARGGSSGTCRNNSAVLGHFLCSECSYTYKGAVPNFCNNCGAKVERGK